MVSERGTLFIDAEPGDEIVIEGDPNEVVTVPADGASTSEPVHE